MLNEGRAVKSRPIIFSAPMVRALLDDSKTQTRRSLKHEGVVAIVDRAEFCNGSPHPLSREPTPSIHYLRLDETVIGVPCPYGKIGDQLWVKESFSGPYSRQGPPRTWERDSPIWYWADNNPDDGDWTKPKPSIFMPRWASRITLEITHVRVERLQAISYEDALAEGIHDSSAFVHDEAMADGETGEECSRRLCWPQRKYQNLWNEINGAGSWDANPWVWVLSFKRVEGTTEVPHSSTVAEQKNATGQGGQQCET